MSTDIRLDGITDPYHAMAHAEQIGRQSRTYHTLSFTATKDAVGLEPGDHIKVELPLSNINAVYRVNSVEISEDLTVNVAAYFIDINSYAWNVSDDYDITVATINPVVFEPDQVSQLTFSTTAIYNGVASGNLSWKSADSEVLYYVVQASNDNTSTFFDIGTTGPDTSLITGTTRDKKI
jgi:hypothetical protein